jgi:hypothetical protein
MVKTMEAVRAVLIARKYHAQITMHLLPRAIPAKYAWFVIMCDDRVGGKLIAAAYPMLARLPPAVARLKSNRQARVERTKVAQHRGRQKPLGPGPAPEENISSPRQHRV